jgi:hypothetical protein
MELQIPPRSGTQPEATTPTNWVWIGFQLGLGFCAAAALVGLASGLLIMLTLGSQVHPYLR